MYRYKVRGKCPKLFLWYKFFSKPRNGQLPKYYTSNVISSTTTPPSNETSSTQNPSGTGDDTISENEDILASLTNDQREFFEKKKRELLNEQLYRRQIAHIMPVRIPPVIPPPPAEKYPEPKLTDSYGKRPTYYLPPRCLLCRPGPQRPVLDPTNVHVLGSFMTEFGDILGRTSTGLCAKHQRRISRVIKRAKRLGVLSYKFGEFRIVSPFEEPVPVQIEALADILDSHLLYMMTILSEADKSKKRFDWEEITAGIFNQFFEPPAPGSFQRKK